MSSIRYRACKWLLEVLLENGSLTQSEISEKWKEKEDLGNGVEMEPRNFHRYKQAIKKDFGVIIECKNRGDYAYFIKNPEILNDSSLTKCMLNNLAFGEKLRGYSSIRNRILMEEIPSGDSTHDVVTDSMSRNKKLKFDYQKYGATEMKNHELGVCCIKLYHQRWYLLGEYDDHKRYTYALDRIKNPEISTKTFELDPRFDPFTYFRDFYGIFDSGKEITSIVFRAFDDEPYYLRDLPIHFSQREIGTGDGFSDFVIDVRPNNELMSFFLSRKNRIKILSPDTYVEEFTKGLISINENYDLIKKL